MSFAYYRLPHTADYQVVRQGEGEPLTLSSLRELNGQQGFVIAPFVVSNDCPIVVIRGDECLTLPIPPKKDEESLKSWTAEMPDRHKSQDALLKEASNSYKETFTRFHDALEKDQFRKLVLSRSERVDVDGQLDAEELFFEACRRYPRMYVALFTTPQTGMWLMATPEVLVQRNSSPFVPLQTGTHLSETNGLENKGNEYFTMALAGTMRLEGDLLRFDNPDRSGVQDIRWSQKNIQEQRLVATYIAETLKNFAEGIIEKGPYTTRAANLVHLRSDFTFVPKADLGIGDMVAALHPTPAVCGLPKEEARAFILENESTARCYYSGFCGPLNLGSDTRFYVSLRCMEICSDHCQLYAGGGLLIDSIEEQEWQETDAKMQTMRGLL